MPSKTQSVFLGALVVGILGTSYLGLINVLCCAGVIIGAMVGVWHYTSEHGLTIPPGQGAAMGALSGILGMLIAGILNFLLTKIGIGGVESLVYSFLERAYTEEQIEAMREQQQSGALVGMMIGYVLNIIVAAIFGAVGGAIGAAVFKKGGEPPAERIDVL